MNLFSGLSETAIDQIYKESALFGTSLCIPESMWSPTIADFGDTGIGKLIQGRSQTLLKSSWGDILCPKSVPWWMVPFLFISRSRTIYWLLPCLRVLFGIPKDKSHI